MILEICADSPAAVATARQAGAPRVELCADLAHGGITPSYGMIRLARRVPEMKLFVLIRPRSGNFCYDDSEFENIVEDISMCAALGCDGVVTGVLNPDNTVDVPRSAALARVAREAGMEATFHRAFDCCSDLSAALEEVVSAGYDRILTSGGRPTAFEGGDSLARLVAQAGDRIVIMPGSGINENNLPEIAELTGAREFHGSFRRGCSALPADPMLEAITGRDPEMRTDPEKIAKALNYLKTK